MLKIDRVINERKETLRENLLELQNLLDDHKGFKSCKGCQKCDEIYRVGDVLWNEADVRVQDCVDSKQEIDYETYKKLKVLRIEDRKIANYVGMGTTDFVNWKRMEMRKERYGDARS